MDAHIPSNMPSHAIKVRPQASKTGNGHFYREGFPQASPSGALSPPATRGRPQAGSNSPFVPLEKPFDTTTQLRPPYPQTLSLSSTTQASNADQQYNLQVQTYYHGPTHQDFHQGRYTGVTRYQYMDEHYERIPREDTMQTSQSQDVSHREPLDNHKRHRQWPAIQATYSTNPHQIIPRGVKRPAPEQKSSGHRPAKR